MNNNSNNFVNKPKHDLDIIRNSIRVIENWPEAGVVFRDITTLLQDPKAFHMVIDVLVDRYSNHKIDIIAGLDARGFIFGPILAYKLNLGFVPIRKKGKLPYNTFSETYSLEYGDKTTVEIHTDAVNAGGKYSAAISNSTCCAVLPMAGIVWPLEYLPNVLPPVKETGKSTVNTPSPPPVPPLRFVLFTPILTMFRIYNFYSFGSNDISYYSINYSTSWNNNIISTCITYQHGVIERYKTIVSIYWY